VLKTNSALTITLMSYLNLKKNLFKHTTCTYEAAV